METHTIELTQVFEVEASDYDDACSTAKAIYDRAKPNAHCVNPDKRMT